MIDTHNYNIEEQFLNYKIQEIIQELFILHNNVNYYGTYIKNNQKRIETIEKALLHFRKNYTNNLGIIEYRYAKTELINELFNQKLNELNKKVKDHEKNKISQIIFATICLISLLFVYILIIIKLN